MQVDHNSPSAAEGVSPTWRSLEQSQSFVLLGAASAACVAPSPISVACEVAAEQQTDGAADSNLTRSRAGRSGLPFPLPATGGCRARRGGRSGRRAGGSGGVGPIFAARAQGGAGEPRSRRRYRRFVAGRLRRVFALGRHPAQRRGAAWVSLRSDGAPRCARAAPPQDPALGQPVPFRILA